MTRSTLTKKKKFPGPRIYKKADPVQDVKGRLNLVSYHVSGNHESEVTVIHAVIRREELRTTLESRLASHQVQYANNGEEESVDQATMSCIHGLQMATLVCLEKIESWRLQLTRPYPFIWKQKNYVLQMARDMDFVYFSRQMKQYLRRGSKKNPFLVPGIQLVELFELLTTVLIRRSGNSDNSRQVSRLHYIMKHFCTGITPLRLRDAVKHILSEEETWGPPEGVLVAPVWASETKEAKDRLVGGKRGKRARFARKLLEDKKEYRLDPAKRYKRFNPFKQQIPEAQAPVKKTTTKSKLSKLKPLPYRAGMRICGRFMALTALDIGTGKTKVTAYDLSNMSYHELVTKKSDLRSVLSGRRGKLEILRNKQARFLFIFKSIKLTPSYSMEIDYNIGIELVFQKPEIRPPKVAVKEFTWTLAKKIGSMWATVVCTLPPSCRDMSVVVSLLDYPSVKQRLNVNDNVVDLIKDHLPQSCAQLDIIRVFLAECLICAGSPPVFFVQDPFASRPNTRVQDQIERVEAGIPFDSRPSTRSIFTPTLLQSVSMPEETVLQMSVHEQAMLDSNLPGAVTVSHQNATGAAQGKYEYIQSVPISACYYARTIYRGDRRYYFLQIRSEILHADTFVQLAMTPISWSQHGDETMMLRFDRLIIEKIYAHDKRFDFSDDRDGLQSLARALKYHISINEGQGGSNRISLTHLQILTPGKSARVQSLPAVTKSFRRVREERNRHSEESSARKSSGEVSHEKRTESKHGAPKMTIMPIITPVLDRLVSAEGHRRRNRPYTAKTHRDHRHYARAYLQKLVQAAQLRLLEEERTDKYSSDRVIAKHLLRNVVEKAKRHITRQSHARVCLFQYVSRERERLHTSMLNNAATISTREGVSIMTIQIS